MAKHLGREIDILSRHIRRNVDTRVNTFGITGLQSRIIKYIQRYSNERDIFQRDIEEEFKIRRSSVTSVLQTMEKNQLIIRESVKQDARLKKLVLTPKAISICNEINLSLDDFENHLKKGISDEEINQFTETLHKLLANLDD